MGREIESEETRKRHLEVLAKAWLISKMTMTKMPDNMSRSLPAFRQLMDPSKFTKDWNKKADAEGGVKIKRDLTNQEADKTVNEYQNLTHNAKSKKR